MNNQKLRKAPESARDYQSQHVEREERVPRARFLRRPPRPSRSRQDADGGHPQEQRLAQDHTPD